MIRRQSNPVPPHLFALITEPPLAAGDFKATSFASAEEKAAIANDLLRFIAEDFPAGLFTGKFYNNLRKTFGQILFDNHDGTWAKYFTSSEGIAEFRERLVTIGQHAPGNPARSYSDIEAAVAVGLMRPGVLAYFCRHPEGAAHITTTGRTEPGRSTSLQG